MIPPRLLLCVAAVAALAPLAPAEPVRVAGVDLGAKGARAVVLEYDPKVPAAPVKVLYKESTNPTAGLVVNGKLVPASLAAAAEDLAEFVKTFTKSHGVKPENIRLVGSSAFANPDDRAALAKAVEERTGLKMAFLPSADEEAKLTADGLAVLASRPRGLLVDVGSGNAKGGAPSGGGLETFAVQFGSVSLVNRTREVLKEKPGEFKATLEAVRDKELIPAVRAAVVGKPALTGENGAALTGGISFAVATLIHPGKADQPNVTLLLDDFRKVQTLLGVDPVRFPDVDTSKIPDPAARKKADADLATVRKIFTPENLLAGTTVVLALGDALKLDGKPLVFTRDSQYAWIVGYLVPEAVKKGYDTPAAPPPAPVGQSPLVYGWGFPYQVYPCPAYVPLDPTTSPFAVPAYPGVIRHRPYSHYYGPMVYIAPGYHAPWPW